MFIDSTYLINKEELEEIEKIITCSICDGIINDPMECILCENNFCNHCIKKWKEKNVNCPFRCVNFSLKENIFLKKFLSDTLKFKCEKGCGQIISYSDFNEHYTISCPNIDKINYKQKFEDLRVEYEKLKIRQQIKIENNKKLREEIKNYIKSNNELIVENKVNKKNLIEAESNKNSLIQKIKELNNSIKTIENEKKETNNHKNLLLEIEKLNNEKNRISVNISLLKKENEHLKKIKKNLTIRKTQMIQNNNEYYNDEYNNYNDIGEEDSQDKIIGKKKGKYKY